MHDAHSTASGETSASDRERVRRVMDMMLGTGRSAKDKHTA